MKRALSAALLAITVLVIGTSCSQQQDPVAETAERVRSFAESKNPAVQGKPLVLTLARRAGGSGDVCACMQVCSAGGRCTGCSCSPPNCGSCATAAELEPIASVFKQGE
jgi:hypothetical protein